MRPLWKRKNPIQRLYSQIDGFLSRLASALKDWRNWVIFALIYAVMISPTWVGWLLYFITKDAVHLTYSSAYMAFWALPLTPLIPLCIAITLAIRKLINKKRGDHDRTKKF